MEKGLDISRQEIQGSAAVLDYLVVVVELEVAGAAVRQQLSIERRRPRAEFKGLAHIVKTYRPSTFTI